MTSAIDPDIPPPGHAYTDAVRANFATAASEVTALQAEVTALQADNALKLLEQKGAVFSGGGSAAADTAAIQALIDEYEALSGDHTRKPRITLPNPALLGASQIFLTAGLTLDVSKVGGFDGSGVQFNAGSLSSGAAFTITGTAGSGYDLYDQHAIPIENFRLLGNGNTGTVKGLNIIGSGLAGAVGVNLRNIMIKDFGVGEELATSSYLIKHFSVNYLNCGIAARTITGTNRGENLQWYAGTMSLCTDGFVIDGGGTDPAAFFVYGMSIDYNSGTLVSLIGAAASFTMIGGWIEGNNGVTPWFTAEAANGSVMRLIGTHLYQAGVAPHSATEFFTFPVPSRAQLINCTLSNFRNTNERLGSGAVQVSGTNCYDNSNLPYQVSSSSYASLVIGNENVWDGQVRDAPNWAGRLNGTNLDVANSTTTSKALTSSVRFTKTNGAGASAIFDIYIPVRQGMIISLGVWDRDISDAVTGTYLIETAWCVASKDENGLWSPTQVNAMTNTGTFAPNDTWTQRGIRPDGFKSAYGWPTHLRVSFNFTALGNGAIYADELYVCPW